MPSDRSIPSHARVRNAARARYDEDIVNAILDAGLVGHLGFVAEGRPMVIPTIYARDAARLYLHGASKTRFVRLCRDGAPLVLTVTLVDGIVAARSAFHHSFNYRSVMVHGSARLVTDEEERSRAMQLLTEHVLPGRYDEVRPMLAKQRKATGVIALEIEAASAKVRAGPPIDDSDDLQLALWSGIIPVTTAIGRGVPDCHTAPDLAEPRSFALARARFSR